MSFLDDTCDYCDIYCDPIGCDTATRVADLLWCGQCGGGRAALFGSLNEEELRGQIAILEWWLALHPVRRVENPTPEDYQRHFTIISNQDICHNLKVLLKEKYNGT